MSDARVARVRPDSDFNRFWDDYPAKVGRKAAERAWAKAKDRPPIAEVLAAVDTYRRTKPADREWCNPATWLNQGRWADVPGETAAPSASPATFDGPPAVRASIVAATDEDFARRWIDPYCRWDAGGRRLIPSAPAVEAQLTRRLAAWAEEKRVVIETADKPKLAA